MHFVRKFAMTLTVSAALACQGTTGPTSPPSSYTLLTINGRQLPTFYSPIPEAPTVISGSLSFDGKGLVTIREQRRDINGKDTVYSITYRYSLNGGAIIFDYYPSCPPFAACVRLPKGTLVNDHALIDYNGDGSLIFDYELRGEI